MNQPTDMVDVYYGFVNQPWPQAVWLKQLQRLPQSLQGKVLRFRRWQDQHMALFGKLLLLEAMMAQGQGKDCLERLEVDERDRPFIAGATDFNISHSGGAVVCAVSHQDKVGIDVELLRWLKPDNFTLCMTHQQIEAFHSSADPSKALLKMWVAKESVAKANGAGLGTDFRKMICSSESISVNQSLYHLYPIQLDSAYLCCVATPMAQCEIQLHPYNVSENNGDDLVVKSVN